MKKVQNPMSRWEQSAIALIRLTGRDGYASTASFFCCFSLLFFFVEIGWKIA